MRAVLWEDEDGYKHRSLVRDDDPDSIAPEGILQDPPNVQALDWDAIIKNLHNQLVDRDIFDYQGLINAQNGVTGAILGALKPPVIALYKSRRQKSG